jgi:hypothetical protein
MNFCDGTQNPGAKQSSRFPQSARRRPLIAHLGDHLLFPGHLAHQAGFINGLGERLLAEAVFAHPHGHQRGHGVGMVGSTDRNGVDLVADFFKHFAEIGIGFGAGEAGGGVSQACPIDITNSHHPAVPGRILRVAIAFAADSNGRKGQLLVGRLALAGSDPAGHPKTYPTNRGALQEIPSLHSWHPLASFEKANHQTDQFPDKAPVPQPGTLPPFSGTNPEKRFRFLTYRLFRASASNPTPVWEGFPELWSSQNQGTPTWPKGRELCGSPICEAQ